MLEYVKICPKCGHVNPESEDLCAACKEFLGLVGPVPASEVKSKSETKLEPQPVAASQNGTISAEDKQKPSHVSVTNCMENVPTLYLDLPGPTAQSTASFYEIKNGWIVGLEHPTSTAQIQLPHVDGQKRYIHRQHCSFICVNGQWFVEAIDHGPDTNDTLVNQLTIRPGQRHPIKNGDKLTLAKVVFNVRIMQ